MPQQNKIIDKNICNELSQQLGISEFLAELLCLRDIKTAEQAQEFLHPTIEKLTSPYAFSHMEQAVKRIKYAIDNNQNILIYGDYDCDGIGAIALLYLCFKEINKKINYYIPNRALEGYGINFAAIDKIKSEYDPQLIITVDCGANSIEEIEYIKSLGIDIIVTDHHLCNGHSPICLNLNPCENPSLTPLCGAGMAFMLAKAVFGQEIANKFLDICAISTIADIVPLIKDNRIIVKFGLDMIRKGQCRQGIKELCKLANVDIKNISSADIGYKIAPRLNSVGRLDTAYDALNLLIEDDPTIIKLLSQHLNLQNLERQDVSNEIYSQAIKMLDNYDFSKRIIILYNKDWQEGVVGIVCAKITEFFNLPTILLTNGQNGILKGSARSIEGINIAQLFGDNSQYLVSYGGHSMAAGLSIKKENLKAFINSINLDILSKYPDSFFKKIDKFDIALPIKSIKNQTLAEIALLEPFGHKNAKPIFFDASFKAKFMQIGKTKHIKSRNTLGDILKFNGIRYLDLLSNAEVGVQYTTNKNNFNGREYNQFLIKRFYLSSLYFNADLSTTCRLKTIIHSLINDKKHNKRVGEQPKLYISYSKHSFEQTKKVFPDIELAFFQLKRFSISQTLVFCPDENFPYQYFGSIVLLDNAPQILCDYLDSYANLTVKSNSKLSGVDIEIDTLRADFLFLNEMLKTPYKFVNLDTLFTHVTTLGYKKSKLQFMLSLAIFVELKLIIFCNGAIICKNNKVNIEDSSIYKYYKGLATE